METFKATGRELEIYSLTGTVVNPSKRGESITTGSGGYMQNGYSTPINIQTISYVHDQFFLIDAQGQEHAFQLTDFDLACREGHVLTVFWAMRKGKKRGPYVAVRNCTTAETYYQEQQIKNQLYPPVIFGFLSLVFLFFVINSSLETDNAINAGAGVFIGFFLTRFIYGVIAAANVSSFKKALAINNN